MKIVVVAVIESKGKILLAKRKKGQQLEDLWEFPGGKLESSETQIECLQRELLEEMNLQIQVLKKIAETMFHYPFGTIQLVAYQCRMITLAIELRVHSEYVWVELEQLQQYPFPPANKELIQKIIDTLSIDKDV